MVEAHVLIVRIKSEPSLRGFLSVHTLNAGTRTLMGTARSSGDTCVLRVSQLTEPRRRQSRRRPLDATSY
jgi:hypothetical protein